MLEKEDSLQVELDRILRSFPEGKTQGSKKLKVTISVDFINEEDGDRILEQAKQSGFGGTWYSSPMNNYLSGFLTKSMTPTPDNLKQALIQVRDIAHANRAIQSGVSIDWDEVND